MARQIGDLPHALENGNELARRLAGRRPAVFLDYDGTLTPIVDRPEDAIISESMRDAIRGLAGRCPVVIVSGRDFKQGKPHPEIFLTAAEELEVPPAESFVVEDAANGVQAAKAGNMAALGLARADDEDLLAGAGADLVVTSLDDVSLDALAEGRLEQGSVR